MNLFQLIREDFSVPTLNDPALHSKFELFFNYPGVWAIVNYRVANKLYSNGFRLLGRIYGGISQFLTNVDIHPACTIGRRVFIDHGFGVVIGETSIINNDVIIYQGVTLGGVSLEHKKRHPTIEKGVILGSGAKILGDIIIGSNSKIGANSVVIQNVPSNSTAVGVPAKVLKGKKKSKNQLDHNMLPDISKEMFAYLLKRVAVLEHAIKEQDGIDISREDAKLEDIYANFIDAMKK
ncbi:Serine acetyltransferase [hydrothermal vent metagenome]|uniref:serine O-acetyltransferase n=1 Tax=hydrothermal vent metagenome TaxID=652676 RepID=A0A3B1E6N5_9ZZZZ